MKPVFFLLLLAVAFAYPARAAVQLTNFNRGDFIVDPRAAPTNVVILNLPHSGSPDLPGDIISLVGGSNFWAVVGGNLHPKVLNNIVQVTNLISYDVLTAQNEFVIGASFSTNLVAGANQLPTWHVGFARLSSDVASATPADRTVTLQGASGSAQGQILLLENIWGLLGTQPSAFTIANGSALWGPGTGVVVLQNGDWAPTQNGESLLLQYDGDNWREVARFFGPGGGSGNAIINPTVNYLPKRGPATNFVDSLAHDDGSWLYVDGTGTATIVLESDDAQLWFGSNLTNGIYRLGQDLWITNAVTGNKLYVAGGSDRASFGLDSGGNAEVQASSASKLVTLRGGLNYLFYQASSGVFGPNGDGGASLAGPAASAWWQDIGLNGTAYIAGFRNGTNHSQLAISHSGTNGAVIFDSQSAGTAGGPRPFQFTNVYGMQLTIATNSGYTGTGANFLSDDGTFKAAPASGPWTNSPTGTASLVAGVTNASAQIITLNGGDLATALTNKVLKAGDSMTGALTGPSAIFTNTLQVGSAGSTSSVTITNGSTSTVPLTINHASGATADFADFNSGGTNKASLDAYGHLWLSSGSNATGHGPGSLSLAFGAGDYGFFGFSSGDARYYAGGQQVMRLISTGMEMLNWGSIYFGGGSSTVNIRADGVTGILQLGDDLASPVASGIKSGDGSGTDKIGASMTVEGGQSTGTGTAGALDVATGLTGEASGSTANAYSIRAHYKPKFVALTDSSAVTIETFSLAANKILGGEMVVTLYATNATPHLQCKTTVLAFQAVAVATTITGTLDVVKDGTTAADSGTLTVAYTLLDNGNNTFSIQANPASSLTTPIERCKVIVTALNGNNSVTITDP